MRFAHDWESVAKVIRLYKAEADSNGLWQAVVDAAGHLQDQSKNNPGENEGFFAGGVENLVQALDAAADIEISSPDILDLGKMVVSS